MNSVLKNILAGLAVAAVVAIPAALWQISDRVARVETKIEILVQNFTTKNFATK